MRESDESFVRLEVRRENSFFGSVEVAWKVTGPIGGNGGGDTTEQFDPSNGSLVFHEDETRKVNFPYFSFF